MTDIQEKGLEGEREFNNWLKKNNLSYLYIKQDYDSFAPLFKSCVKRPDFLVLIDSIGLIAVDVKNCTLFEEGEEYTLNYKEELIKVIAFERLFRIPMWYSYMNNDDKELEWYWITALKAIEVGEIRKNKEDKEFLAIKQDEFVVIKSNDDLGKLYTQRLPGLNKNFRQIESNRSK